MPHWQTEDGALCSHRLPSHLAMPRELGATDVSPPGDVGGAEFTAVTSPRLTPVGLGYRARVHTRELRIETGSSEQVRDLTAQCRTFLHDAGAGDGLLHVWVPHATAGLAVIETGSGSDTDLLAVLRELLPADGRWRHRHGSAGHGRDHLLPALLPPYASIPVLDGQLALGTWQSICLVDTNGDNPVRTVRLSFLPG
jgi:secondary thiamine-phosphate synthase enzyme